MYCIPGAYSASFNGGSGSGEDEYQAVLNEVKAFEEKEGRRPRLLVAKMGQVCLCLSAR